MRLKHYLSILAIAVIAASCSKEGPTGPQGPPGENGVSDLTATYYTVSASDWTFQSNQWYYNTTQIVPNGDGVMVYWSSDGSGYSPLPATYVYYSGDELTYIYGSSAGLTLWYSNNAVTAPDAIIDIEIVDIPPAMYVKYPKVNWNNYAEVSALPEYKAALAKVK